MEVMFSSQPSFLSSANSGIYVSRKSTTIITFAQGGEKERIRRMFSKIELSVSPYDTAWVAMVPSPDSSCQPCFPKCLNWLLENQHRDGSWSSIITGSELLIKDSMLSTLASVLALRRWEVGEKHVRKGLEFILSNFGATIDDMQESPMGFDIIFPGMIEYAEDMGLNLPLSTNIVDTILRRRDIELERVISCDSMGSKAYMAYISEGLTKSYHWKEMKKCQRKNGSLSNSPSATAAYLIQNHDTKGFEYLQSILNTFSNAVPTVYPVRLYIRLRMVDCLERLGIQRYYRIEIKNVLDETYRCWLQRDEDIFLDIETCALAFRLLRTNGYDISSDPLSDFNNEEDFFNSAGRSLKHMYTVLELHKASEIIISQDELVLETLHLWTSNFLNRELSNGAIKDEKCRREVDHALRFPYEANVERLYHRRNIECYDVDNVGLLKTSYWSSNINNEDFQKLAVQDYNFCQSIHKKELQNLERWVQENRLDQLKFARQKMGYLYFSAACILYPPEQSDARMSFAKGCFLVVVVDDFFDGGGCREELENLIELAEKWNCNSATQYCSDSVEILFKAIYETISEFGDSAFIQQGRNVTRHLIDMWRLLLECMMQETQWASNNTTPTMDQYMETALVTTGTGPIVLISIYFLGHKLSEGIITSTELNNLDKYSSLCLRLLNDLVTFKREAKQGKINSVLLYKKQSSDNLTEQDAMEEIKRIFERSKRELLNLVLTTKGSIVPKACKDLFWMYVKLSYLFYGHDDGFSSPTKMLNAVRSVLCEQIDFPS